LGTPLAESFALTAAVGGRLESVAYFAGPAEAVSAANGCTSCEVLEAPATGAATAPLLATGCGWAAPSADAEDEAATELRNEAIGDSEPPLREAAGCLMVVGPVAAGCGIELPTTASCKAGATDGDGSELALVAGSPGFDTLSEAAFEATFEATVGAAFGATCGAATTEAEASGDAGCGTKAGADNDATTGVDPVTGKGGNADAGDAGSESG